MHPAHPSVNQMAPSGPLVMPRPLVSTAPLGFPKALMLPAVVMRPIRLAWSTNHSAPSEPAVIDWGVKEPTGN